MADKYYYKTEIKGRTVLCTELCPFPFQLKYGIKIGSTSCEYCSNHIERGVDETGYWLKCSGDLETALSRLQQTTTK